MRRPQSAFGLVAVMSSLVVVSLHAAPASGAAVPVEPEAATVFAAAGQPCTSWGSESVPPPVIRVLRTEATGPPPEVLGTVQEVDFRSYVATVMAAEWPESYPLETLKAGAVVTKQYAWYHILNPRGGTTDLEGLPVCYDVVDSTRDQFYQPERRSSGLPEGPGPKIMAALDATWDVSLRKFNRRTQSSAFRFVGYRDGSPSAACGEDATGFKLFHNSTRKCGKDGLKYREILRRYLKPNLEIVTPGRGDVIGSVHGDARAMKVGSEGLVPHVWTPGQGAPQTGSRAGGRVASGGLVDYGSADMDGNGLDDLVWLTATGPRSASISVALSDGAGYRAAEQWWSGNARVALDGAHLLLGDFHGDQRTDAAILGRGGGAGGSRLVVLKRKRYSNPSRFFGPSTWWSGPQDPARTTDAWAGDLSGDGRADLIVRQDGERRGVAVRTAVTLSPLPRRGPRMGPLRTRFDASSLVPAKVRMVPADANRDGREDLLLLIGGSGRARVERLQGALLGGLKRVPVWIAPKAAPIRVQRTRLGAADVDYDGMTDLILYAEKGKGTRIRVLRTGYDTMAKGPSLRVGIDWRAIRPY